MVNSHHRENLERNGFLDFLYLGRGKGGWFTHSPSISLLPFCPSNQPPATAGSVLQQNLLIQEIIVIYVLLRIHPMTDRIARLSLILFRLEQEIVCE